jgi:hypothetical protein
MKRHQQRWLVLGLILLFSSLLLAACTLTPLSPEAAEEAWAKSAHADAESDAFSHWNNDDPAGIPVACAACHSTSGFLDFHGVDGSAAGEVNQPAAVGGAIECDACHTQSIEKLTTSTLPSGLEARRLGANATCYDCHQGRTSGAEVEAATAGMEGDDIDPNLAFINIHANAAGPLLLGAEAGAGYHYMGKSYAERFTHVPGFDDCVACHDAHTLRQSPMQCAACHVGVRNTATLRKIRVSSIDYDGDGKVTEGIFQEIETLQDLLLQTMREYVEALPANNGFRYLDSYPYFVDSDRQPYTQWTPRLLRAAYNYQVVATGGGIFAHNPNYAMQLLYDSIEDMGGNLTGATRPATR